MIVLGESSGDDPDDAWVPTTAGENEGRRLVGVAGFESQFVGCFVDAPFERFALVVEIVDKLCQRERAFGGIGDEKFQSKLGLAQAAGGVEARADGEADVFAIELGFLIEFGDSFEGGDAGRGEVAEAVETVADEDAVFVDERDDIGDGADGGEADGAHEKCAHRFADAFGVASLLAEGPSEFQGDGSAAEAGEGVG